MNIILLRFITRSFSSRFKNIPEGVLILLLPNTKSLEIKYLPNYLSSLLGRFPEKKERTRLRGVY